MAVAPLIVIYFYPGNISSVLTIIGASWIMISFVFLVMIVSKFRNNKFTNIAQSDRELLKYSIMRVPGDFALAALLALPATITTHLSGVKEAGFMAFGISTFSMVAYLCALIGTILLPKASQMIVKRELTELKTHGVKIFKTDTIRSIFMVIIFEIFAVKII